MYYENWIYILIRLNSFENDRDLSGLLGISLSFSFSIRFVCLFVFRFFSSSFVKEIVRLIDDPFVLQRSSISPGDKYSRPRTPQESHHGHHSQNHHDHSIHIKKMKKEQDKDIGHVSSMFLGVSVFTRR